MHSTPRTWHWRRSSGGNCPEDSMTTPTCVLRKNIAWILTFTVTSYLFSGYGIYVDNQAIQFPLLDHLHQPALYGNDPFVNTLSFYASTFWIVFAHLEQYLGRQVLLLLLYFLERILLIVAGGCFAATIVPYSKRAVIAGMAVFSLSIAPLVGQGTVQLPYLEHTGFAIPWFMFAFTALIRRNFLWSAACLALAVNCNIMYGLYALTYGAVIAIRLRLFSSYKDIILPVALGLGLSLPTIIATLRALRAVNGNDQLWLVAAKIRFPHHLLPLAWDAHSYVSLVILGVSALAVIAYVTGRNSAAWTVAISATYVALCWLLLAYLSAYLFHRPFLLIIHPARGTDLWYPFVSVATAACVGAWSETATSGASTMLLTASCFIWAAPTVTTMVISIAGGICWSIARREVVGDSSRANFNYMLIVLACLYLAMDSFFARAGADGGIEAALYWEPPPELVTLAKWCEVHTPQGATFLVDPTWSQFRPLAHRAIFVSWKDGSAMFWDRPYASEWVRRLEQFNVKLTDFSATDQWKSQRDLQAAFRNIGDNDAEVIADKYHIEYWIVPAKQDTHFVSVGVTSGYKIVRLSKQGKTP